MPVASCEEGSQERSGVPFLTLQQTDLRPSSHGLRFPLVLKVRLSSVTDGKRNSLVRVRHRLLKGMAEGQQWLGQDAGGGKRTEHHWQPSWHYRLVIKKTVSNSIQLFITSALDLSRHMKVRDDDSQPTSNRRDATSQVLALFQRPHTSALRIRVDILDTTDL